MDQFQTRGKESSKCRYVRAMKAKAFNSLRKIKLVETTTVHRTLSAMILRGERQMTLNHVRILAKNFGMSPDLILSGK